MLFGGSVSDQITPMKRIKEIHLPPRPVRICHHPWPSRTIDQGSCSSFFAAVRCLQKMLSMFQTKKPPTKVPMANFSR